MCISKQAQVLIELTKIQGDLISNIEEGLSLSSMSKNYAERVLDFNGGNKSKTARQLYVSRGTLNRLLCEEDTR